MFPAGSEVVMIARTELTVIVKVAVAVELAIEVAVTVAVELVNRMPGGGALYVTEVVVLPVNPPTPERLQFTPSLLVSFATVAVIVTACPGLSVCPEEGDSVTVTVGLEEQPSRKKVPTTIPKARYGIGLNFPNDLSSQDSRNVLSKPQLTRRKTALANQFYGLRSRRSKLHRQERSTDQTRAN